MTNRTTRSLVTFTHSFTLAGLDDPQPAGTYEVDVDEEMIEGLSFPAYRRTATLLHLPSIEVRSGWEQVVSIDFKDLQTAQERDRHL